jgi:hypothetical protein
MTDLADFLESVCAHRFHPALADTDYLLRFMSEPEVRFIHVFNALADKIVDVVKAAEKVDKELFPLTGLIQLKKALASLKAAKEEL